MTGLVNLITEHSSKLNILLIVVLMNVAIAILIHFLIKKRIVKYLPSLFLGIGALFVLFTSFQNFTSPRGLNLAWIAVFLGTAALVGLFTAIILDLAHSIRKNTRSFEEPDLRATKTKRKKKVVTKPAKTQEIREVSPKATGKRNSKVRVAKKHNRSSKNMENPSKYNTSKILIDSETKKVKASKIDEKLNEKITFEADTEDI